MLRKNIKKGFSLVELLVVITIIAILSVVAYTAVGGQTIKARDSKRKQDLNTIQSALEIYFVEYGRYPTAPLVSGTGDGEIPKKFLSSIPTDPGANVAYIYESDGTTFEIAATLEIDGKLENYETFLVGNSDLSMIFSGVGQKAPNAKYLNVDALADCNAAVAIASGTIGAVPAGPCIPYDPYTP